ncbi:hypothetical protein [Hydrogenivirga sp. 128-5-R1-1]|uniref:hypothetical protein n=1 Tax=Hydrogenivirga sp. 128-5-R1-1 TaxID=392423 RepID=UPI00015F0CF7|nr:hypothetical protein [Hydrogenivirga sp. 128-5-R1-1]EDP75996.1 hypothetical protein HG1285_06705 [Hydrogenivirga sp. 128-5-R1-1]
MAQIVKKEFLESLLTHEIKELSRIKAQLNLAEHVPAIDNVTVAVVPVRGKAVEEVTEPIKRVLRDSDVMFPGEGYLILLLPGTDEMGAIHILEGVSEFLGGEMKFSYVVYPQEGESAKELVDRLKEKAKAELGVTLS